MENERYKILEIDPWLRPHAGDIALRMRLLEKTKRRLCDQGGTLSSFANGHMYFGFHRSHSGWYYREWAPNAERVSLFGDFNGWDREGHQLKQTGDGVWQIFLRGGKTLPHESKVRIQITAGGETMERIPLYIRRAVQNPETAAFDGQIWQPDIPFAWTDQGFKSSGPLLIYESHAGISGEEPGVATYTHFADNILPRVQKLGYNTVQLMAVQEHPYYGSFGYQVSNFFAVSSRFGTPEELKYLINKAHSMGIAVLLDLVHSHAAPNEVEGIGRFDGTTYQFFHDGARGEHPQWGTKLFNYGKPEVVHFLLSNLKFWLEEYHFDGFRFDGVTSMLYQDHGLGGVFDNYDKYFSMNTDTEAVTYLQLAAELSKEVNPRCMLIAEDMSGMPGMCLPVSWGGVGFDYRLGMGTPDMWVRNLKTKQDESWSMRELWHELNTRRPQEKVVGYCESHDQALVGDKTIMFWLADKEMYWHMDLASQNPVIDRAMALHKMIRLITCTCAGEAYLNFMGNEFGHPEWIDFPREGNGNSYHYARRQWSLADDKTLRYQFLQYFDRVMIRMVKEFDLLAHPARQIWLDEDAKFIAYEKNRLIFLFNFHPVGDFAIDLPSQEFSRYETMLHTGWTDFGGYKEPRPDVFLQKGQALRVSLDRRAAAILRPRFD